VLASKLLARAAGLVPFDFAAGMLFFADFGLVDRVGASSDATAAVAVFFVRAAVVFGVLAEPLDAVDFLGAARFLGAGAVESTAEADGVSMVALDFLGMGRSFLQIEFKGVTAGWTRDGVHPWYVG
jgi:hypothetical protein